MIAPQSATFYWLSVFPFSVLLRLFFFSLHISHSRTMSLAFCSANPPTPPSTLFLLLDWGAVVPAPQRRRGREFQFKIVMGAWANGNSLFVRANPLAPRDMRGGGGPVGRKGVKGKGGARGFATRNHSDPNRGRVPFLISTRRTVSECVLLFADAWRSQICYLQFHYLSINKHWQLSKSGSMPFHPLTPPPHGGGI